MSVIQTSLDENGFLPVEGHITTQADSINCTLSVNMGMVFSEDLKKNINGLLRLKGPEGTNETPFEYDEKTKTLTVQTAFPVGAQPSPIELTLNNVPIGRFTPNGEEWELSANQANYQLTCSECRMLSHHFTKKMRQHLPYKRDYAEELGPEHVPVTDIHTHLSSQISAHELLDLAVKKDLYYPRDLLEKANEYLPEDQQINFSKLPLMEDIDTFRFNPAADLGVQTPCEEKDGTGHTGCWGVSLKALKSERPDSYHRLARLMSVPFDGVQGPDDFDKFIYRFRNPLEKHPLLAGDKIKMVAKKYKEQGVEYAEMSTGSMLNPAWLEQAIPAIEAAERDTGVKIRLLVGISRSSEPNKVADMLERTKLLAKHPLIVGIDFLGFESNPTSDFSWAIYNMARWSRRMANSGTAKDEYGQHDDEFIIRVHAGENNENTGNVTEVIDIAQNFNVPIRIGHCLHVALNDEMVEKVKKANITLEFIEDSWIALSNATFLHETPVKRWIDTGVNYVLGSDGAGAYDTSPHQQAKAALASGATLEDLKVMRKGERDYIAQRDKVSLSKKEAFKDNFDSFGRFVETYKQLDKKLKAIDDIPDHLRERKPILLAGASGTSWKDMSSEHQKELIVAAEMMVDLLDPQKVFFATGRVKDRGVERCIDRAVVNHDHSEHKNELPFDILASGTFKTDSDINIADGTTWALNIEGKTTRVPEKVLSLVEELDGTAIFAGGKVMTGEYIRRARESGVSYGLVQGPSGTADDESHRESPEHVIHNGTRNLAESILRFVEKELGTDVFREQYQEQLKDDAAKEALFSQTYDAVTKRISKPPKHVHAIEAAMRVIDGIDDPGPHFKR